jgi:hypothetical protein
MHAALMNDRIKNHLHRDSRSDVILIAQPIIRSKLNDPATFSAPFQESTG